MSASGEAVPCPLEIVSGTPVYEQVAAYLVDRIRDGTFRSGDRLPNEAEMSAKLNVGRSSVREALRVMASRNLVTSVRGVKGGTFVVEPDADLLAASLEEYLQLLSDFRAVTVSQLLETRAALEVPATRYAAERGSEAAVRRISIVAADQLDVLEASERFRRNRDFHIAVLEASENRLIQSLAQPVFGVLRSRFDRTVEARSFWKKVDKDHRHITDCITNRDPTGAAEAMRVHLENLAPSYERMDRTSRS